MHRLIVSLLAALDAVIVVAVALLVALAPLALAAWLASDNLGLNGVPRELILDVRGLVHVTDYLDAHRARG